MSQGLKHPRRVVHPTLRDSHRVIALRMPMQVIKRFIKSGKKAAFVVEHELTMAAYLADRVIVFDGQPSVEVMPDGSVPFNALYLVR